MLYVRILLDRRSHITDDGQHLLRDRGAFARIVQIPIGCKRPDDELHYGRRRIHQRAPLVRILLHQLVGIEFIRQRQNAQIDVEFARVCHQSARIEDRDRFAIERLTRHVQPAQHRVDARRVRV